MWDLQILKEIIVINSSGLGFFFFSFYGYPVNENFKKLLNGYSMFCFTVSFTSFYPIKHPWKSENPRTDNNTESIYLENEDTGSVLWSGWFT